MTATLPPQTNSPEKPALPEVALDISGATKADILELTTRFEVDFLRLQFTDIQGVNKNIDGRPGFFWNGVNPRLRIVLLISRPKSFGICSILCIKRG